MILAVTFFWKIGSAPGADDRREGVHFICHFDRSTFVLKNVGDTFFTKEHMTSLFNLKKQTTQSKTKFVDDLMMQRSRRTQKTYMLRAKANTPTHVITYPPPFPSPRTNAHPSPRDSSRNGPTFSPHVVHVQLKTPSSPKLTLSRRLIMHSPSLLWRESTRDSRQASNFRGRNQADCLSLHV